MRQTRMRGDQWFSNRKVAEYLGYTWHSSGCICGWCGQLVRYTRPMLAAAHSERICVACDEET